MSRRVTGPAVALLLAGIAGEARAELAVLQRLQSREETIAQQAQRSEELARQQARAAYRLARRRQLGFMAMPEARLEDARALDLALFTVRRSAGEARVLRDELGRVQTERQRLELAAKREPSLERTEAPHFSRPVRGTVVGEAGLRRDPVTGVEVRADAVQLLARMNEPVRAPAGGTVRRVEAQPQGGFAVVMAHEGGWSSVVAGLREVSVSAGDSVAGGGALGLAGRNLDGAAVVSLELWHGRTAVDPAPLLERRRK